MSQLQIRLTCLAVAITSIAIGHVEAADGVVVTIRSDFPGGNVLVLQIDGSDVNVAPDLRGDRPWFYWCFEASTTMPGRVTFAFPVKVAGFKQGSIMAATFEFPFAPPGKATDPASCRDYGAVVLEAWTNTHFRKPDVANNAEETKTLRPHPDALPNSHKAGEVDKPELVPFVVADSSELAGIVIDESDAKLIGEWRYSTHTPPYVGLGYLHDQKQGKGKSSVTYTPNLPEKGMYEVRLSHCYNIRRSTNTPVTIHHANGETTLRINQQEAPEHGKLFRTIGTYQFQAGKQGWVRISTHETDGKYVIADAVQFLRTDGADGTDR